MCDGLCEGVMLCTSDVCCVLVMCVVCTIRSIVICSLCPVSIATVTCV